MALPEEFLRELRSRNDIENVISGYVHLRRRGRTLVGLCPFHGEKTPSFTVYPDTDSFYCFGCQAGGDVITFIKRMENLDYIDAVRLLAERSGLQMPENRFDPDNSKHDLRMRIYAANREAAMFYYNTLYKKEGAAGLDYLKNNRGLTDRTIRSFGLGFAPDSMSQLTDYLINEKKFTVRELAEANLTIRSQRGGLMDRFRNRVMFPIIDVRGNVIAFGGRIMSDEKPKYLNTSDTPVYKKTNNLFALNKAKGTKEDKFILCEGYMDVIALYQAGFDNAVAGLGTALTEEQAKMFKRYRKKAVLCYDSDEAGQNAAMRAIHIFDKQNVETFVVKVPDGKDPDEYIKRNGKDGYTKFRMLVDGSKNEVDYFYDSVKSKHNIQTTNGKLAVLTEAAQFLASLSDPLKRDLYTSRISEDMGVKRDSLERAVEAELRVVDQREANAREREVRKVIESINETAAMPQMKAKSKRSGKAEEMLTAFLMVRPEYASRAAARLSPDKFSMPFAKRIYECVISRVNEGKNVGITELSAELDLTDGERSKLAKMVADLNEQAVDLSAALCDEYINVVLTESEKLTVNELSERSDDDISDYIKRRREQEKKRKQQQ